MTEAGEFRRPLLWDEVPLPPGYPREILDPDRKNLLRLEHRARRKEVLAERAYILSRAEHDPLYQEKVIELCRRDTRWFIDHFVWTYDDRLAVEEPMVLYPFQVEKIVTPYDRMRALSPHERWTRVGCKSRGIGWTWVGAACDSHSHLFLDNWSTLLGAVTLDDVDDGGQEATTQSLYGKVRFIFKHLPRWMLDRLLGPNRDRDEHNKRLHLKNPLKPLNVIHGKQLGGMFGRGRRYTFVRGDEIAHSEEMQAADTSLKQTTRRFEGASTPRGKHTFHAQLFLGGLPGVQTYYIHWSEHPELDLDWYNREREHMTDEQVAQELDCSFEASAGGRVLKEVHLHTHFTLDEEERPDGLLVGAYDPGLPVHVIIDPGISDALAVTWGQWDEGRGQGRVIDFAQKEGVTIDWCVPFILGQIPTSTHRGIPWPHDYTRTEVEIVRRHARWRAPETVFGDQYGSSRDMVTGLSAYDELARYGIFVYPVQIRDDLAAIARLELLMRYVRFARRLIEQRNGPSETCPTMGEVVTQWRFPHRKVGDYRPVVKPIHDRYCHGGDTLKMWAQMLDLPEPTEQPVASGRAKRARGSDLVGGNKRWPGYLRGRHGRR